MGTPKPIEKPQWRATALAVATAVLLGFSTGASALALGPITVQSALGEPLRAEIDVPDINADELSSLRAGVATPAAFRTAGLEYNAALTGVKITLERRTNGRYFLRLSSDRAVTDPFLDLILETTWSSGRIVRDYTMLFDPPNLRPGAPLTAQTAPVAPAPRVAATPAPAAPAARTPAAPATRAPAAATTTPATPSSRQATADKAAGEGKQVTVQSGDTAGRIAAANKPANISLDQMLVAMLRANPDAFIHGNVNRLKSGAVLEIPTAEQAGQTPPAEANRTVIAQSRDFNEFRRRLAEGTPATRIGPAERQASGKVQAQVEDKRPGAAAPDKLTLSKGAMQGKGGNADKIARERAAQDSATRLAELNKNIADLNKLGTSTSAAPSGTASAAKPGIPVPLGMASGAKSPAAAASSPMPAIPAAKAPEAPAVPAAAAAASAPSMAASAPVAATDAAASASAPVAAASTPGPMAGAASAPRAAGSAAAAPKAAASKLRAAARPAETSFVDDMLQNPIVPATLGGILALLLGFGFYRAQQRRKSAQVDSSFLESRLQPDSFFGASGGQRIDTNESSGATGSSMVYSPSQLDAAGDVDPVAEADVYLAYGRDLQAEEILKEAMRVTPQRVAIHSKLLEIYSKRRDAKAFEHVASEAYGLTRGEGPEWEHICELGQELDPSNALYRPGGQPAAAGAPAAAPAAAASGFVSTQAIPVAAPPASDVDLDLDFSIGDDEPAAPPARANPAPAASAALPDPQPMPSLDMDFGAAASAAPAPAPIEAPSAAVPDLILDDIPPSATASPASSAPPPAADPGMIEFDLGALSLDLDAPAAKPSAPAAKPAASAASPQEKEAGSTGGFEDSGDSSDPLATKLALAEEFNAIGDPDGARSLAQEVLAEASGDLKSRAQRLLAEIS